jgi:iron complex transport system permease protein
LTAVPATRPLTAPARPVGAWLAHRRARVLGLGVAVGLLGLAIVASLAIGSRDLDPLAVVRALVAPDGSTAQRIVTELRLPRTLVGLAVGMALGMAGLLMQGVTRNPLADPGLLGVAAGASFAVVMSIRFLGTTDPARYAWFAIAGAALATVAVHLLARTRRRVDDPVRLVLAGAVLSALLQAGVSAVLVSSVETMNRYRFWMVGSLADASTEVLAMVLPLLVVGGVMAALSTRALDALSLGEDVASALGARVGLIRVGASAAIVLLTAASVVLAGPIVFVGLVVPHIARSMVGPDHRWLFPYCLLGGAILVLVADTLGRVVARPGELQVGIMTALIGAPVLLLAARRRGPVGA